MSNLEIIKDIIFQARKVVGDFPIYIKMNSDDHIEKGISRDNFAELVKEIEATGVDAIEVSRGMWDCLARFEEELGFFPLPIPESRTRIHAATKQSYYYDNVKNIDFTLPLILVGGHRNIERMENLLVEGKVDFLSLCRPLICEPDLPNRWMVGDGNENAACESCNACILLQEEEFGCILKRTGLGKEHFESRFIEGWRDILK